MTPSYEQILKDYPEHMSMEQMRIVCHISKRTARYLMNSGRVPCIDSGKKTRRFQIATVDVIKYLEEREKTPDKYTLPNGSYARSPRLVSNAKTGAHIRINRLLFEEAPDMLTSYQAAVIAGVTPSTVTGWVKKKHLKAILVGGTYRIPKISLLIYLASPQHSKNYRHRQYIMAKRQCAATTE